LGVAFYRGSDCCLLVFDLTNLQSFQNVQHWKDEFLITVEECSFVLVGNKSDLEKRVVKRDVALEFARRNNMQV
jgi:Ras-related protein Rab-7A